MSGQRKALIIANDEYEQEALRNLLAPAADAVELGRVLADPQIGDFAVQVVRNEPANIIMAEIEEMLSASRPDDVLLLHFSGHGLKNESGELFFAASNTRPNRLGSTAVSADFVQRCMRDTRSRSVVLLLDCCYGGAFAQGVQVRAAGDVHVLDSFPQGRSGGRGRAVITASNAMEYAFEGDQLGDDKRRRPSVFTTAVVEGLATGDADRDEDGMVSLSELYDYVFDKVRAQNPHQTPSRRVELEGELYLAKSQRLRIRPVPIPADLQAAMASTDMYARLGAVHELRSRLASGDLPVALGAYEALTELAGRDTSFVARPAAEALSAAALHPAQTELRFGRIAQGSAPPHQIVPLLGPPIARACTPRPSDAWIRVDKMAEGLDISIDTAGMGTLRGGLSLKGQTGEAIIAIDVDLVSPSQQAPTPPSPGTPAGQGIMADVPSVGLPERQPASPTPLELPPRSQFLQSDSSPPTPTAQAPPPVTEAAPETANPVGDQGAVEPDIGLSPLPQDLRDMLNSPRRGIREAAVAELAELLDAAGPGLAVSARQALERIAEEDDPQVAALARIAGGAPAGAAADQVHREQHARQAAQYQARRQAEHPVSRGAETQAPARPEDGQRRADEGRAPEAPTRDGEMAAAPVNGCVFSTGMNIS